MSIFVLIPFFDWSKTTSHHLSDEVWKSGDKTPVLSAILNRFNFQRHIVLLEIVVLARNVKANDVNLISMARSTDFCFKTTYICFYAYDRLYVVFIVLFVVRHPLKK